MHRKSKLLAPETHMSKAPQPPDVSKYYPRLRATKSQSNVALKEYKGAGVVSRWDTVRSTLRPRPVKGYEEDMMADAFEILPDSSPMQSHPMLSDAEIGNRSFTTHLGKAIDRGPRGNEDLQESDEEFSAVGVVSPRKMLYS